jgi:hypothetical protein
LIPYIKIYDASIINYLKYEVLPIYFTERVEDESLVFDEDLEGYVTESSMVPLPTSAGRGWVMFDETTVNGLTLVDTASEQTTKVSVTGATTYDIDYVRGRIINADAEPTSVSYSWHYISFVEGWPGTDPPPLPIVAVDVNTSVKSGYQLGGGTKDVLEGSVYIFATSESEKKEITDVIYQALYGRALSVRNWHEGSYLDFDGTYSGFQPSPVNGLTLGAFTEVAANLVGPRMDWSEVNRHRSQVDFTFEVYKD